MSVATGGHIARAKADISATCRTTVRADVTLVICNVSFQVKSDGECDDLLRQIREGSSILVRGTYQLLNESTIHRGVSY